MVALLIYLDRFRKYCVFEKRWKNGLFGPRQRSISGSNVEGCEFDLPFPATRTYSLMSLTFALTVEDRPFRAAF